MAATRLGCVFRDYENMINIETEITTDANALNIGDSRLKIIFCSNGSPKMSDIKLAQSQMKSFLKLLEKAK